MKIRTLLFLIVSAVTLLVLSSTVGCAASPPPTESGATESDMTQPATPEPDPTDSATAEADSIDPATPEPGNTVSTTPEPASAEESPTPAATDLLEGVIMTRTPEPTPTPGRIEQGVEELVDTVGLARTTFLGLSVVSWINLAISLLYVLAGYLIGTWLIRRILPRVVGRTRTEFDDWLLGAVGGDVRWLVVILALYVATMRLTFVSAGLKTFLGDVYFVVGLVLVVRVVFRTIDLADGWARQRMTDAGREGELEHVIVLLTRLGRVATALIGLIILLAHFGVNVTALSAALGLGGLAITLAAQDTIADAIAGFIILVDRPFRVGDRIEIQGAGTWGDVLSIGLRTTRIRTRDNRVIILPNSTISSNRVTNYSYPDPSYRSETHLSVGYDTDLEVVRRLVVDTVRGVEGVLADRPIDALYIEMGASGAIFRVRWWIGTYVVLRRNLDQVHTALQAAFDQAGIPFASTTQSVKLRVDPDTVRRVSTTFKGGGGIRRGGTGPGGETDA
jgi:MscS family membrane protein